MRLNDLYRDGMWRFLNINVTDYSEEQVDEALQGVQADENLKQTIKEMLINTRLKKSPNFAFREVLDEKSFKANALIVREIVELLQEYKFRYKQKHQFLGDFFELLLNTSMKQEAGQFFTPVPITRFIISSLPIKENINGRIKNNNNDNDILPTVIDYAMGSGHFLTEYMEQVQNIINDIDDSKAIPTIKNKIKTWRESEKFSWAKDYVYGIDLDDRLVKTAKVSAFFNGDGEANIIWANGLANFLSDEYIKKLKHVQPFNNKNNSQFDILISNPPYSVDAFKTTLNDGKNTFELYNYLTDNSSEIECLFIERMKQLLKVGGWAGVILPISILSNGGIYSKTREIIFKYFKVKAIVELGSGTFMKTGTNTIILFLERRFDNEYKEIENSINRFFNDKLDVTVSDIENAFSKFVLNVYDNLTFDDYIKIIEGNEVKHELYDDYIFDGNYILIGEDGAKWGSNEDSAFIVHGKFWANNHAHVIQANKDKVLDIYLVNILNHMDLSSYITGEVNVPKLNQSNLLNIKIPLPPINIQQKIVDEIEKIEKECNIELKNIEDCENEKNNIIDRCFSNSYDLETLENITDIYNGGTPDTSNQKYWNGEINWATLVDTKSKYLNNTQRTITKEGLNNCNATILPVNSILFSSRATIGDISIAKVPVATNQGYKNFVCKENKLYYEYLYYILKHEAKNIEKLASGMTYPEISKTMISKVKIPLPAIDEQKLIVNKVEKYEKCILESKNKIEKMKNDKENILKKYL